MVQPRVKCELLYEGKQHTTFNSHFLKKAYFRDNPSRDLRVVRHGNSIGSAEQLLRNTNVNESIIGRKRAVAQLLIVSIDGDLLGVNERLRQLDKACLDQGVPPRSPEDKVAIFVPTREIETWLAYLDEQDVDEVQKYPKLDKQRQCKPHVNKLVNMCRTRKL